MNVKLSDGKIIVIREPVEKHQLEWWRMVEKGAKEEIDNFAIIKSQNDMILELSDLTQKDLDKMSLVDKSKIKKAIASRFTVFGECSEQQDF